nr:probable cytochrome P450 313a2 [Drosophila bipectinata]
MPPILIFAGLLVLFCFLWSRRRFYKLMLQIPGPLGLPLLGSVPEYAINKLNIKHRTKFMEKYGSTILAWAGIQPVLVSRDPKIAENLLTAPQCLNRSSRVTKAMESIFGKGILTLQDSAWTERRKHMNASFKQDVLLSFVSIFNSETKNLLTQMDTLEGHNGTDVLPHLYRWSFSIAHQTTLGTEVKDETNFKNNTLIESWNSLAFFILLKVFLPLFRNTKICKIFGVENKTTQLFSKIDVLMNKIIDLRLHSESESSKDLSPNIAINRVMELYRNGEITLDEVKGESCNMVLAAFETTALTLNHLLIVLAMFPQYQELLFEELKEIFPAGGDLEVEYEDVQKLVYLDRVLNETLRLFPPIPISIRDAKEDLRLSNGVLIPKGVILCIDIFNIHRNRDLWGHDADTFDPDRFLPDNIRQRHPYAFIPYSKGKRNCIGWRYAQISLKIALAKIVRNYSFNTSFRYEDLAFIDNIVIKLDKAPLLNFNRRTT